MNWCLHSADKQFSQRSGMSHEAYATRIQSFYGRKYKQGESGMKSTREKRGLHK